MKIKIALIVTGILLVVALVIGFKFSRAGVESPDYRVINKEGTFEIREYPAMVIVSTPMENPDPGEGTSFKRLFRYISGDNETEQKIAMTTPVLTSQENGDRKMSFIVPEDVANKETPNAKNKMIKIETLDAGRFAVYRFSGAWDVKRFDDAKTKLVNWIQKNNLVPIGDPIIANYDPPFTPPFLRRNEILIRI